MKKLIHETMDPARVALLLGVTLGLGIVVHEGFFLVAGAIAAGSLAMVAIHAVQERTESHRIAHNHR